MSGKWGVGRFRAIMGSMSNSQPASPPQDDAQSLQTRADAIAWFHSIDLGNGVRTRGMTTQVLGPESFPSFAGRSVLDIGAWDGYHSFLAERAGAARVVALDHYVWGVDIGARQKYWAECAARGELPDHGKDMTDFWRPDLPGRRGFDFARAALGSAVEPVVADFMTTDLDELGCFDVVLYLGVLYHMKVPLTALERVRQVTTSVAVVETEAVHVPDATDVPLLLFEAGDAVAHDYGNWYVPTLRGLKELCRAAGFRRVEVVPVRFAAPPSGVGAAQGTPALRKLLGEVRGRIGGDRRRPAPQHLRALVHAYV
jgi:tRNA (mo5U34)-methyltransferase